MTVANAGRPSGLASAASRIWPTTTPISAPASVAAIAASERNSSVSRRIAMATPIELADRCLLLGREVDEDAARGDVDAAALAGLGRLQERLAVGLVELLRLESVAHGDRGQPPVG